MEKKKIMETKAEDKDEDGKSADQLGRHGENPTPPPADRVTSTLLNTNQPYRVHGSHVERRRRGGSDPHRHREPAHILAGIPLTRNP